MTNREKMQILRDWHRHAEEAHRQMDGLENLFSNTVGTPFGDAIWTLLDEYNKSVARLIGCESDSLRWHSLDNVFGKCGLEEEVNGVERPICTVEDLAWMLGIQG